MFCFFLGLKQCRISGFRCQTSSRFLRSSSRLRSSSSCLFRRSSSRRFSSTRRSSSSRRRSSSRWRRRRSRSIWCHDFSLVCCATVIQTRKIFLYYWRCSTTPIVKSIIQKRRRVALWFLGTTVFIIVLWNIRIGINRFTRVSTYVYVQNLRLIYLTLYIDNVHITY